MYMVENNFCLGHTSSAGIWLSLLLDGLVGDDWWIEDLLSQRLQHLLPVVVEAAFNLIDGLVLNDPQLREQKYPSYI